MKKTFIFLFSILFFVNNAIAREVKELKLVGPYLAQVPVTLDTADVNGKQFDFDQKFFDNAISSDFSLSQTNSDGVLQRGDKTSIALLGYQVENTTFMRLKFSAQGGKRQQIYVDGVAAQGTTNLVPGRHDIAVKVLIEAANDSVKTDSIKCSFTRVDSKDKEMDDSAVTLNPTGMRYWTLSDLMNGERLSSCSISATGKFAIQNKYITRTDGKTEWSKFLINLKTGEKRPITDFTSWADDGDRYIRARRDAHQTTIYEYVDAVTGKATPFFTYKGSDHISFVCHERYAIISRSNNIPDELNKDVHQILEPDDRQPGWRNRNNIYLLDVKTGVQRQLTEGQKNSHATLNHDGSKALLQFWFEDMTQRPFTFSTALLLDLATNKIDTLYQKEASVSGAQFSPDDKYLLFQGSPEDFNGVGNTLPDTLLPSLVENELYLMELSTKQVKCITRDFDPSIKSAVWNLADGNIYALTENRDRQDIFRYDVKKQTWTQLPLSEPYIYGSYSFADNAPYMIYTGESSMSAERTYLVDLKSMKETILDDINPVRLNGIKLGECTDWNFVSSRGDTIYGCCYLPPHFDQTKKYPLMVYYYGGCSPVGRYLDSYYCYQEWAAMGYVVYVIQPSGASGFGQEFASRHVNTYGDYSSDDIIEGTKRFCQEHPYVNPAKIGCMGASYGGFMTQWLQVKTDIFAAAMSHAGISNPASYWGFGYWGYSYSAISAAHSYPWNNVDLYSGHAPLFHADKVHTPLLFMHGAIDTNVPINESIQMFTALKILGRETAFVTVEGQDHHILDYNKRIRWHDTIMAWFQRFLQDDATWWETMYPTKNY